jgi:DnaJ-class molecular chaperone
VHADSSNAEVTAAYRRLSLLHHPDKNIGDATATDRFQRISAAHEAIITHRRDSASGKHTGAFRRGHLSKRTARTSGGDQSDYDDSDLESLFDDENMFFCPDFEGTDMFDHCLFM